MNKPYCIIEFANSHGGDFNYLKDLLAAFEDIEERCGVKFQAFHPDKIAEESYDYYELYKLLYFEKKQWQEIINQAKKTKDVWLDIFDTYGVEVLKENISSIFGIKFQSSVLYNYEVFDALQSVDLTEKKVILNVAAYPVEAIAEIVERISQTLSPQEILLEFGYQAYPTQLEDSGLCKLNVIREQFSNRVVFADHVDGRSDDAIWLPVVAAMRGVDVIEKHVKLEDRPTEYDHFSSLTPDRFKWMMTRFGEYKSLEDMPFITRREEEYLEKTLMIPILKHDKAAGSGVNLQTDFIYRRSGKQGLNAREIEYLLKDFHILAADKKVGDTLQRGDLRKATIATIIACRLKSSRLPRKALLNIGNLSSVERCIKSCLEFRETNLTILATSDLPEDAELQNYTYRPDVFFHRGDPEDVIRRYLGVTDFLKIDVVVRVTADCPFVSHRIVSHLLEAHFASGADYTVARRAAVGTSAEIINTAALKKVKEHFTQADYSEYMTWYFQNNPEHFRLNFIDLPDSLIRNYRLTLDYPEDLEMLSKLQGHFDENGLPFDLEKAFIYLDAHPDVSDLNAHLTLRYKTDQQLIDTLNRVTKISSEIKKG